MRMRPQFSEMMLDNSAYLTFKQSQPPRSLDSRGETCGRTIFATGSLKCTCLNSKRVIRFVILELIDYRDCVAQNF
jgi:hypothetical protein